MSERYDVGCSLPNGGPLYCGRFTQSRQEMWMFMSEKRKYSVGCRLRLLITGRRVQHKRGREHLEHREYLVHCHYHRLHRFRQISSREMSGYRYYVPIIWNIIPRTFRESNLINESLIQIRSLHIRQSCLARLSSFLPTFQTKDIIYLKYMSITSTSANG